MARSTLMRVLFATATLAAPLGAYAQTTSGANSGATATSAPPVVAPAPASEAQTPQPAPPPSEVGEVVVTAQKRSESVQSVPINISVLNGNALSQAGITTPGDLQRLVPTFKYSSSLGSLASRFSIRGVGSFSNSALEPSVAFFQDGIYVPRPASLVNSLLDVQSVEVLSGPQGTLFGRNASVGAITFTSGQPKDTFSDDLKFDYSTGDHYRVEDVINIPVNDKAAVRIAGLIDRFGGYWHDDQTNKDFGGIDTSQVRVSGRYNFTDNLTWTTRAEYQHNSGDGAFNSKLVPSSVTPTTLAKLVGKQGGIVPNLDEFSSDSNANLTNYFVDDTTYDLSSDLSWKLQNGFTLRLLDGYANWDSNQGDGDTAALDIYVLGRDLFYRSRSNSHELQVISPKGMFDGRFDFVGGLYYFHEDFVLRQDSLNGPSFCPVALGGIPAAAFPGLAGTNLTSRIASCETYTGPSSRGDFRQSTDSGAAYFQGVYHITPQLAATAGVRYTDDDKVGHLTNSVFNPTGYIITVPESDKLGINNGRFTYRANLAWTPLTDVLLFGTASTGFKSGGFNNGLSTVVLGERQRLFSPETTMNYELGVKSRFFDRRLTLNLTGFRMDIDNYQERSLIGLISAIRNVGSVRQQGLEFEGVVNPMHDLQFNASATYLDSDITSYCGAALPPYLSGAPAVAAANPCPGYPANTQNLKGARLTYNPKWSGVFGGQYGRPLGFLDMRWTLNGDVNFVSNQQQGTSIDNSPLLVQKGYALLDSRLTLYARDDKWSLGIYGRNLADKGYCSFQGYQVFDSVLGLRYNTTGGSGNNATATRCFVGNPRVVGMSLNAHF